jgi:CHAD domain-containing protein
VIDQRPHQKATDKITAEGSQQDMEVIRTRKKRALSNLKAKREATVGGLIKELAVQELTNTNTWKFITTDTCIRDVFPYTFLSLCSNNGTNMFH